MLREAEVGDFDMAVSTEEDVLGLEVPVNDVLLVQVVESEGDLSGKELGDGVRESLQGGRERWVSLG